MNYARGEAYALRGLAAVKNAKGDPDGALQTLEQAAMLQKQTPDARLDAQIHLARGVALHRLRQLPASREALEAALGVFRQADSLNELRATYGELASVLADMGNWREGYASSAQRSGNLRAHVSQSGRPALRDLESRVRHRGQGQRERTAGRVRTTPTSWRWRKASARATCNER